jgi:hypothetical protein
MVVANPDAFVASLTTVLDRAAPGETGEGRLGVGNVSVLSGRARPDDIFMEFVPANKRGFFGPQFVGRLSGDSRALVGRFRLPRVAWLLVGIFWVWLCVVFLPTIVAIVWAGSPQSRVVNELLPVLGGLGMGLLIFGIARFQMRGVRKDILAVLHGAAQAAPSARG